MVVRRRTPVPVRSGEPTGKIRDLRQSMPSRTSENSVAAEQTGSPALHDAAVEISRILRAARVDAPLRVKAVAALLLALQTPTAAGGLQTLAQLNARIGGAIGRLPLAPAVAQALRRALRLDAHFSGMLPHLDRIASLLADALAERAGPVDAFSVFYEAFLRYGSDNNALGIVFTPAHIARFCASLVGVTAADRVIDLACGTGSFLVAARQQARLEGGTGEGPLLAGFDPNPTVWALAVLNAVAAGSAAGAIERESCLTPASRKSVARGFTRAFLNPPFSQGSEPERDFIDATMEALEAGGRAAVLVKAGIFADEDHAAWRAAFQRRHSVLAVIAVPDDVFYPTSAPAAILIAEAHRRQAPQAMVMMARVANDGFEKLKNRRVARAGCELPEVARCFAAARAGRPFSSPLTGMVSAAQLAGSTEWSPHEWLPQQAGDRAVEQRDALVALLGAVADHPELSASVLAEFGAQWRLLPPLRLKQTAALGDFFHIENGRSAGERHYGDGGVAYVSSSGMMNSIVRLIDAPPEEVFHGGGITVTAFGQASVQPWPFAARGNGGSAVRVLRPRFAMGDAELLWFAAQINAQRWRFFYARMAIKSRIERLVVASPAHRLPVLTPSMAARVQAMQTRLDELCRL